jgi:Protein of unknown function (DUF1501)
MSDADTRYPILSSRCRGPVSRRSFLELGALSVLGLGMGDYLRAESLAKAAGRQLREKAVIFIWLPGGMSHLESYDMKPDAPAEYRGLLNPIRTNVPGIEVSELFPMHAKIADKYALIRSISHEFADHGGGHKRFLTGRIPATPVGTVNDAPSICSITNKLLSKPGQPMPASVAGVDNGRQGIDTFAFGSAYLGPSTTPFMVVGDPSAPDFKVQNISLKPEMEARMDDRIRLLEGMDRLRRDVDRSGLMGAMDEFSQRAYQMLTSKDVQNAFDLGKEPDRLRDRYGRHAYGQRGIMARRLVEAGSRFVTMVWENPGGTMPRNCTYNWDSHAVNCHMYDDCRWRYPMYDQALTALIDDVYDRGLDKDVMIIATGEFGRTPKISTNVGTQTGVTQPGRDHWPGAMSLLVSGGGMRTGQIVGATNARGEYPVERPLSPNDLWATVYRHLRIDYDESFPDLQGRPMPILPFGRPIEEILPATV